MPARTVFDAGLQSDGGANAFGGGARNLAGTFRPTKAERESGPFHALPFDERPAERPMADALPGAPAETRGLPGKYSLRAADSPTFFRERCGMRLFSWEED